MKGTCETCRHDYKTCSEKKECYETSGSLWKPILVKDKDGDKKDFEQWWNNCEGYTSIKELANAAWLASRGLK